MLHVEILFVKLTMMTEKTNMYTLFFFYRTSILVKVTSDILSHLFSTQGSWLACSF